MERYVLSFMCQIEYQTLVQPVDIWASGITLYMFTYGHLPFISNSIPEMYEKIRNDQVEFPDKTIDGQKVNPRLIDLLQHVRVPLRNFVFFRLNLIQILEKDPEKRYRIKDIRLHDWARPCFVAQSTFKEILPSPQEIEKAVTPMTVHAIVASKRCARTFMQNQHSQLSARRSSTE